MYYMKNITIYIVLLIGSFCVSWCWSNDVRSVDVQIDVEELKQDIKSEILDEIKDDLKKDMNDQVDSIEKKVEKIEDEVEKVEKIEDSILEIEDEVEEVNDEIKEVVVEVGDLGIDQNNLENLFEISKVEIDWIWVDREFGSIWDTLTRSRYPTREITPATQYNVSIDQQDQWYKITHKDFSIELIQQECSTPGSSNIYAYFAKISDTKKDSYTWCANIILE